VDAAGGVLPGADIGYLNLARKLTDGELVLVGITPSGPVDGVVPPEGSAGSQTPATVNLNTATLAELETLPGIGPVLAQRILDYRISHGGFRAATDLRKVDGIGTARFEQLKDRVSV
jgi:competence protein ComEA